MTRQCFICGEGTPAVLEEHHVIPRRFGGADTRGNLVTLCANCHRAIERIYSDNFFEKLGLLSKKSGGLTIRERDKAVHYFSREADVDTHWIAEAFGLSESTIRQICTDTIPEENNLVVELDESPEEAIKDIAGEVDTSEEPADEPEEEGYSDPVAIGDELIESGDWREYVNIHNGGTAYIDKGLIELDYGIGARLGKKVKSYLKREVDLEEVEAGNDGELSDF